MSNEKPSDTCEECGRPFPVPLWAHVGNTTSPCFRLFYDRDGEERLRDGALIECKTLAIKNLRAQVRHLEAALENYDTTDAQNHAAEQVIRKLNRILDERRQVGTFGNAELQMFARRILRMQLAELALAGYEGDK